MLSSLVERGLALIVPK